MPEEEDKFVVSEGQVEAEQYFSKMEKTPNVFSASTCSSLTTVDSSLTKNSLNRSPIENKITFYLKA